MASARPPRSQVSRVLIVDGDTATRLECRQTLERSGFVVDELTQAATAVAAFERLRPDLVLIGVASCCHDGFETLERLRALPFGDRTPIVAITDVNDADAIQRAYDAGATDFITRPVSGTLLDQRIRYILRSSDSAEELRHSRAKLARAQRIARLGSWDWDIERNRVTCSEELYEILNIPEGVFGGTFEDFLALAHPDDRGRVGKAISDALARARPFALDHRFSLASGEDRVGHTQGEVTVNERGKAVWMSGTIQDITDRRRAEERIQFLAFYDALTGLPNQTLFKDRLTQSISRAGRMGGHVAVLFIDLDRFKRINDTLGHDCGDRLLKAIADRLDDCVRQSDSVARLNLLSPPDQADEAAADNTVSRMGGDSFMVLLTDLADAEDAAKVARRIRKAVSRPVNIDTHELHVTATVGISLYPVDGQDPETLLKNADAAMHYAKDEGQDSIQFYTRALNAQTFEALALEGELHKALENDGLNLYYQPQIDLGSGQIVGAEALLRWDHPDFGFVSPEEFVPLAEEIGLIVPIGEWVLRTACAQARRWHGDGSGAIRVAVNLSGIQFRQTGLIDLIEEILADTGLPPGLLDLEITENVIMKNAESTVRTLRQLKRMGVGLCIDDFGTGYSSLSYLKRFPIDTLKIDRSFVHDVTEKPENAAISRAIIAMGHSLKLRILGEGVESEDQLAFLIDAGCDEMQGFLFSPAVPAEEFTRLLESGESMTLPLSLRSRRAA